MKFSSMFQGKTALVSQQPWIQNCTLQDNILFSDKLNKRFYKEVLEVCGLEQDLKILPGGDQTEIGEKVSTTFFSIFSFSELFIFLIFNVMITLGMINMNKIHN